MVMGFACLVILFRFPRFGHFGCLGGFVSVVSLVSFRWYRFGLSDLSTCRAQEVYEVCFNVSIAFSYLIFLLFLFRLLSKASKE